MHSGGVIHRDLKPSNILINDSCHARVSVEKNVISHLTVLFQLADFGLARSVTQTHSVIIFFILSKVCDYLISGRGHWPNYDWLCCHAMFCIQLWHFHCKETYVSGTDLLRSYSVARGSFFLSCPIFFNHNTSFRYTKGTDMWSMGCILAELIRGTPLFRGTSSLHQLDLICQVVILITILPT